MSKNSYHRWFSVDGRVNNEVSIYFQPFGWKVGHSLMEPDRMKELFTSVIGHPRLSDVNRAKIENWLYEHKRTS